MITSQQQKITTLQATLEDKQAQLKAVANNQTMLHATLKSALQSREKEIEEMKTQARTRQSLTSEVIESMIREQATTEAMELRQKLASDGAQLGRLVYNRVGMHTVENWEEGEASRSHKRQRNDLKRRRDTLDGKKNTLENCDESTNEQIEMESARESVMMHLEELEKKEIKLAKEEQALYVEKGVHIRALKRVSSEDTSRFNSRPKVRLMVLALLKKVIQCCCLGLSIFVNCSSLSHFHLISFFYFPFIYKCCDSYMIVTYFYHSLVEVDFQKYGPPMTLLNYEK